MYNITLITTVHEEKGLCNASALHQILERARPEVIFLEIPPSFFKQYFEEKNRSNLESNAVNRYLKMHSSTQTVPVDIYEVPEDFWPKTERLYQKVEDFSSEYRRLVDRHSQYVERYGFAYLNSKYCIDLWSALNDSVKVAVEKIGEEELSRNYESWKDVIEHRDKEMIKNIQEYSEEHEFNTGIFLIGAAHRRSIVERSKNVALRNSVIIDWDFEKYEGLIDINRAGSIFP